jgi:hypothetical protein
MRRSSSLLAPFLLAAVAVSVTGCGEEPTTPSPPLRNAHTSMAPRNSPIPRATQDRRQEEEEAAPVSKDPPPPEFENTGDEPKEKPEKDPPIPDMFKLLFPDQSKVLFVENLEGGKRKIHLLTEVCLREGQLEALLCKNVTKEHESLLRVDVDGRHIHAALLLAGGVPGSPAKFWDPKTDMPDYKPATGSRIKISLTYFKGGKLRTDPAQYWIKDAKANKELNTDWVFAGSRLVTPPDEPDAQPFYTANNGDFISIANFPDSMLDLPVKSSKENEERGYEAIKSRIPPQGTKVILTLEPVPEEKK